MSLFILKQNRHGVGRKLLTGVTLFIFFFIKAHAQTLPANQNFQSFSSANPITVKQLDIGSLSYYYAAPSSITGSDRMYLGIPPGALFNPDLSNYSFMFNYTSGGAIPGAGNTGIGDYRISYASSNDSTKKLGNFGMQSIYLAIGAGKSATITLQGSRAGRTVTSATIALSSSSAASNTSATGLTYNTTDAFSGTTITFGTDWQFLDGLRIVTPNGDIPVLVDNLTFATPVTTTPTVQTSTLVINNIRSADANLSWVNGDGDYSAVFMAEVNAGEAAPVNNTAYTANAAFKSGGQIDASGWYCVYDGQGTGINVTGLSPGTTYRVMTLNHNGIGGYQQYYTAITTTPLPTNIDNFTTIAAPSVQASNISLSSVTGTGASVSWTNGNGIGRAVFISQTTTGNPVPSNNTNYSGNARFMSGNRIPSTGWYCVYSARNTSVHAVSVTGLTAGQNYRVMVLEYNDNGSGGGQTYNTSTAATDNPFNFTTDAQPVVITDAATAVTSSSVVLNGSIDDKGDNTAASFQYDTDNLFTSPVSVSATPATVNAGSGITSVSATVSGLDAETTYYFRVKGTNAVGTGTGTVLDFTTQSNNADLSALGLNVGTLAPVFAAGTDSYTAYVSHAITSISVTPTAAEAHASIQVKVNSGSYATVNSGDLTAALSLNVGLNTISIQVTAEDGVAVKTYTIVITRNKIAQHITFNATATKTYGNANYNAGAISDNNTIDVIYSSDNTAVATIVSNKVHIVAAGSVNIKASQAGNADYIVATDAVQHLTIQPKSLTITANNVEKTYGQTLINQSGSVAFTASATVGAETLDAVNIAYGTGSAATSSVNTYAGAVTASAVTGANGFLVSNYNITYAKGDIIVEARLVTVTADAKTKIYGGSDPALTYHITTGALVGTDAFAGRLTRDAGEAAGTYSIEQGTLVLNNSNYTLTYTAADLSINKKELTITADDKSRNYGGANPALTVSYNGFVNGDNAGKLTKPATATTTANNTTLPGSYTITPSGAASANYSFNYVPGRLIVKPLANASMINLAISAGSLTPAFAAGTFNYNGMVSNEVEHITITPAFSETATAIINGRSVSSGNPSFSIPLQIGDNTITIVLTAQNGITKATYKLVIIRDKAAVNMTVNASNILTPNGDGMNDTWVIKDIERYPNNIVTVFDKAGRTIFTKHGYNNDWDATLKGTPLAQGTYYYIIQPGAGMATVKGFITILKSR